MYGVIRVLLDDLHVTLTTTDPQDAADLLTSIRRRADLSALALAENRHHVTAARSGTNYNMDRGTHTSVADAVLSAAHSVGQYAEGVAPDRLLIRMALIRQLHPDLTDPDAVRRLAYHLDLEQAAVDGRPVEVPAGVVTTHQTRPLLARPVAVEPTTAPVVPPAKHPDGDPPVWIAEQFAQKQRVLLRLLWGRGMIPEAELNKALGYPKNVSRETTRSLVKRVNRRLAELGQPHTISEKQDVGAYYWHIARIA